MPLPLYQHHNSTLSHPNKEEIKKFPNAHGGLWFEKFFQGYSSDYTQKDTDATKRFFEGLAKKQACIKQTTQFCQRRLQLVDAQKGVSKIFVTDGYFITGMGQNHPVENGLSWHPTLAAPYLTGASVKGLLRHWIRYYNPELYHSIAQVWFGHEHQSMIGAKAGQLIFFDAIPYTPVQLTVDIMTPHYGSWYSEGHKGNKEDAPHDAHTPVPITFLAVKQAEFLFSIAPRNLDNSHQICAANKALKQLEKALKHLGAGAKTATGYGRMKYKPEQFEYDLAQIKYQQKEAKKSPIVKEMDRLTKELEQVQRVVDRVRVAGSKAFEECTQFLVKHQNEFQQWSKEEKIRLRTFFKQYPVSKKKAKKKQFKQLKEKINALKD